MFWLIESDKQLQYFIDVNKKQVVSKVFLEIIQNNDNFHPALSNICLFYIRPIGYKKGFIFSLNHPDTFSINKNLLKELFNTFDEIYVRNKKSTLYFIEHKNISDINFISNIEELNFNTPVHQFFYRKYNNREDINKLIPIVKHYERCEEIYEKIEPILFLEKPQSFDFYNNKISPVFYLIEKNGIKIDEETFTKYYETENDNYSIKNKKIYTQYNLYTTTRRPSNSFNSINFAALNKTNNSRQSFIPENDAFIEFDISSYHPTLVAKMIGMDFSVSELYNTIGKETVFRQLYGGIQDEYLTIPYFAKCKEYINEKWDEYNKEGIITPISNFIIKNIDNPNPYKVFNYLLQNLETSYNTIILLKIFKLLNNKKSKIVLYVYDSILIDFSKDDGDNLIKEIKDIFNAYKLNVKTKIGYNYDSLYTI